MSRNEQFIDEHEIRKAISMLKPSGEHFEVRIIGQKRLSGYFGDAETLINALRNSVDLRSTNVYITLNELKDGVSQRTQFEHFKVLKGEPSTGDGDIASFSWLFIDVDPVRPAGISASDAELNKTYAVAKSVYTYLKNLGFEEPIKAVSGNGSHLLYKIGLVNTEENKQLLEDCLNVLDAMFSTEDAKIDVVNFNPSRICKLYGTLAQKGADTEQRPHRMSRILTPDVEVKQTTKVYLQKLADALPKEPEPPQEYNNYNPSEFDVEQWMDKHGIRHRPRENYKSGFKYVLEVCPFNENHKAPDSVVYRLNNGALGFKCSHNSCSHKTWKDFRTFYEPDAYDRSPISDADKHIEEGWKQHNRNKTTIPYKPLTVSTPEYPMFETAMMILDKPEKEREFIRTGIKVIDKKMMGLEKGTISVVSGLRASAKSTLLSNICLNAIDDGQTVICYSGELTDNNFLRWMLLQAAGKANTRQSREYENYFTVAEEIQREIGQWMGDHFWLYNNEYGNQFSKIVSTLGSVAEDKKADLIIIDNLMALDLHDLSADKYDAQTAFVWALKNLAKLSNTHIIFVAHPKKADGFLRLDDISGSGNISNIVDNAFIIHRINEDFKKKTKETLGWKSNDPRYESTNCIEICKSREGGIQDEFVPLWYEVNTKRLKNDMSENIHYGWEELPQPQFTEIHDDSMELPFKP